ncbi:MAG: FGGY-family carbohydrate kinase [Chloroflexi bacterium]|nr:FGGY-family carbohydrate kinase [Chloroflexota bacterium]
MREIKASGLRFEHTTAHFIRAILEGVALSLRHAWETLLDVVVPQPQQLVAAGGGMQIPLWRNIVASVLGESLHVHPVAEHSAHGAALLAGVSTGWFPETLLTEVAPVRLRIDPNSRYRRIYDDCFGRYRTLAERLSSAAQERD